MNSRERIINTVLFKKTDRVPMIHYFGPWPETVISWKEENKIPTYEDWDKGLYADSSFYILPVNYGFSPDFGYEILENRERTQIVRDSFGVTKEISTIGSTIPRALDFPVKCQKDFDKLKEERLSFDRIEERLGSDWKNIVKEVSATDKIIQLGSYPFGLFGTMRELMGVEEFLISFYTQPMLIHDMMDTFTDLWLKIYERVCMDIKPDCIHMWEDMSGKTGCLISNKMIAEFMTPNYRKIKEFADTHDIPIFSLDTDGNVEQMIPELINGGINLLLPFEVSAGCDVVKLREKFPSVAFLGGIDKRKLAGSFTDIDKEIERVAPLFGKGYIPDLDHLIPPDVSYENYVYYNRKLWDTILSKADRS